MKSYILYVLFLSATVSSIYAMDSREANIGKFVPSLKLTQQISEEDSQLSPRSMYYKGVDLLKSESLEEKEYGAQLVLKSARNGGGEAISHFDLSCDVRDIEDIPDYELLQALINAAS